MTKKFLLLNGPSKSGKDTLAEALDKHLLTEHGVSSQIEKFAKPLKQFACDVYCQGQRGLFDVLDQQGNKDQPHEIFYGKTPREIQICISEIYFKPVHGKDIFGKMLAKRAENSDANLFLISDSGFYEEAEYLMKVYGPENFALVRLLRDGANYDNDSRGYIDLKCKSFNLYNNGTIDEAVDKLMDHLIEANLIDNNAEPK